MQDIGGCRVVLPTVGDVISLAEFYETQSKMKHPLSTKDDYISNPQKTGYRGCNCSLSPAA
jgi:ppGpp synthetase/RelA/SpoT-type nucleotidyltranferase